MVGMEQLRSLVLLLVDAERSGGRALITDSRTLVLYDCMSWDFMHTDAVVSHHPEVKISVRASRQSLSGFSVTFQAARCVRRETVWYLVIGFFLACCGYILLRPPWWAGAIKYI
jgi:hypothetical protein